MRPQRVRRSTAIALTSGHWARSLGIAASASPLRLAPRGRQEHRSSVPGRAVRKFVTHDERIAATADRLISMRDGAFIDETRLTGGTTGSLADLAGLGG